VFRSWLYNIALTLTYGPLATKLYLLDKVYWAGDKPQTPNAVGNRSKNKSVRVSDSRVVTEILLLLIVDILLLLVWTVQEDPSTVDVLNTYPGVEDVVRDSRCSSQGGSLIILIGYKICIFGAGVFYACSIWTMPAELNESKSFLVSILTGVVAYALNLYVQYYGGLMYMRFVGIFFASNVSVFLIVYPRFFQRNSRPGVPPRQSYNSSQGNNSRYSSGNNNSNNSNNSNHSDERRRSLVVTERRSPRMVHVWENVQGRSIPSVHRSLEPSYKSYSIKDSVEDCKTTHLPISTHAGRIMNVEEGTKRSI